MLGPSIEQITSLLAERRAAKGSLIEAMRGVRDTYNGDVIIPLPEMDKQEKPAVANLITTGLDQTAMRIASTMPSIFYPPVREGYENSEKLSRARTQANAGWWQAPDARADRLFGLGPEFLRPLFFQRLFTGRIGVRRGGLRGLSGAERGRRPPLDHPRWGSQE